jgi:hypothetical protein
MVGKRTLTNDFNANDPPQNGDIERGLQKPKFTRFKDVVDMATAANERTKIKQKLTEGIDRESLEKYRKSKEELKDIRSKQIRGFYERQNQQLDDWLEVDTVVMSMADDILDSMNPDRDGDGVAEQNGALQGVGGRIEELLPEDEREDRLRGEKRAKWAINVGHHLSC